MAYACGCAYYAAVRTAGYDLRDLSATINDYRVPVACVNYGAMCALFPIGAQVFIQTQLCNAAHLHANDD
ncbi:hypothetical protein HYPSUDRAFT_61707 [Hypholoma sublateritium FD-334 SS-4]|uniref:Uncharacterized protein n=1 Tax=Hypholoma sublateritium (strain FD-334 SS-4) TaxID=945553 RepID=A0A0D2PDD7_HYPSF|nr:hypothetical protein HYPSUDRAFT_61707 [Hypholoma sublateritium FD-334 SS-4]